MQSKSIFVFFVVVFLVSCTSPTPSKTAVQVSSTPIMQTETAEPRTNTPTPKPKSTEIKPASPTAEVVLNGLIVDLDQIPTITAAEEQAHIQKAIETASVPAPIGGESFDEIQVLTYDYGEKTDGKAVRIVSNPSQSFLIRDTYQKMIETEGGELPVRKVLIELYVTFENGSRGSVILPVIIDASSTPLSGLTLDEHTQKRLDRYSRQQQKSTIDFRVLTNLEKSDTTNPVILELLSRISSNEETQSLLEKAYRLAKEGKFLSQEEINKLLDAIIDF